MNRHPRRDVPGADAGTRRLSWPLAALTIAVLSVLGWALIALAGWLLTR